MATFERQEGRNLRGIDLDAKDRDLEQYGVWVKAEPQDVFEEAEGDVSTSVSGRLETAVEDESFLSEEDKNILGAAAELPLEGDIDSASGSLFSPIEPEEDFFAVPELGEKPLQEPEDIPSIPDIAEFESLEDLGVPLEAESASSGAAPDLEMNIPEIPEISLEEEIPAPEEGSTTEFEPIDIDLKFDDTLPPRPVGQEGISPFKPAAAEKAKFETVTDFDDFLNNPEPLEEVPEAGEIKLPAESPLVEETTFDDVAELEKELAFHPERPSEPEAVKSASSSDILLKIAGELSSIKDELVSLKNQIAAMKAEAVEPRPAAAAEGKTDETGKAGGFFDEEEDETIALTGDELDNILNTAEFSEESAETHLEPAGIPSEEPLADLLPESGDYEKAEAKEGPGIEEIRLSSSDGSEAPLETLESADEAMTALAHEGVSPITTAPEDTSYLEGELSEADALSLESDKTLPEAPLLESLPEELDIDELVEDRFEDAEELPLAEFEAPKDLQEPEDLIEESEELEELTLDVESEPSNIVLESPEHVEMPIPEIEVPSSVEEELPEFVEEIPMEESSDNLGEIALHKEEAALPVEELVSPIEEPATPVEELPVEEIEEVSPLEPGEVAAAAGEDLLVEDLQPKPKSAEPIQNHIREEVRSVLSYLDKLLESLPEEKIEEFAKSEHFETYKRLFEELGLV